VKSTTWKAKICVKKREAWSSTLKILNKTKRKLLQEKTKGKVSSSRHCKNKKNKTMLNSKNSKEKKNKTPSGENQGEGFFFTTV